MMITFKQFNESWARGAFPNLFSGEKVEHPDNDEYLKVGSSVRIHSPETNKPYNNHVHTIHSIVHDYDGKPYAKLKLNGQLMRRESGRVVHVPLTWLRHA